MIPHTLSSSLFWFLFLKAFPDDTKKSASGEEKDKDTKSEREELGNKRKKQRNHKIYRTIIVKKIDMRLIHNNRKREAN